MMRFNVFGLRTGPVGLAAAVVVGAALLPQRSQAADDASAPLSLQRELAAEDPLALARDARQHGDAARGALLFHQHQLACAKCHATGQPGAALGPDLAAIGTKAGDAYLVESILAPSKEIKKGYQTVTVVTDAGTTLTALLAEQRPGELLLRDVAQDGTLITLPISAIEQQATSPVSIMPEELLAPLSDRGQFLDLLAYVIDIAEHGPARADALRPPASLFTSVPLPDYERHIDHAAIIASLDDESYRRGEALYNRVCVNCHGTREKPGSLPTSLRFAEGAFKNGSDPFSMYQTMTRGFGMMAPQTLLVPRQKYDVIHYVREAYLRAHNPSQYVEVQPSYLERLPQGDTVGPEPVLIEPWVQMDYGPSMLGTFEIGDSGENFAYKGIAVRLDAGPGGIARGRIWMLYDHDTLRLAAAWTGKGFVDFNGIHFNGLHESQPRLVGDVHLANPPGPGWANPADGRFEDTRLRGRDGRCYGPLPHCWAHYEGLYHFGHQAVLSYTVGEASVLELPGYEIDPAQPDSVVFSRTLQIGACPHELLMRVAPQGMAVALADSTDAQQAHWTQQDGFHLLAIAASTETRTLKLLFTAGDPQALAAYAAQSVPPRRLDNLLAGGPRRWPETIETTVVPGEAQGPFACDVLSHPEQNPWSCQVRLTGLDFRPGGNQAAVCTWDGDVWIVTGLNDPAGRLSWQRVASGLFEPLGLKIIEGAIYVTCRDQIVILRDFNADGETDFYQNFNNDHQVTEHFHEFAMGLQTDAEGNLYYAKSARHAKQALVPHHGTLLRVSPDGSRTDIIARGFRAANGVCLNPDGSFFVTDQEGHWNPKNRINWVTEGGFYGNMWAYHDVTDPSDQAMQQPLCWITNHFDRSPGELLWVDSPAWGPLEGALLNLSYGQGKIYVVPHEKINGQMQGGMCALDLELFPTGIMRGRFHPADGQLYACGMYAWAGNQQQPGGFYRIRHTGAPTWLPVGLHARTGGMQITFTGALDPSAASLAENYGIRVWSLKRTANYGSDHYDEKTLDVAAATLSEDGKTVFLEIPEIAPTWCMEIRYSLKTDSGQPLRGAINNTIHHLAD